MSELTIPTYPARPVNGGNIEAVPVVKSGVWFWEPKINGHRILLHLPTRTMFNRKGELYAHADMFKPAAAFASALYPEYEWLDCEGLGLRHRLGKGTLIVLDTMDPDETYVERVTHSYQLFDGPDRPERIYLPRYKTPEDMKSDWVYCLNSIMTWGSIDGLMEEWEAMKKFNEDEGVEFFEGFVAKQGGSFYPRQLGSPTREFPQWTKHRFV